MSLLSSARLWLFLVLTEECGYLFKKHQGARRYVPVRHVYLARTSLYTGNQANDVFHSESNLP